MRKITLSLLAGGALLFSAHAQNSKQTDLKVGMSDPTYSAPVYPTVQSLPVATQAISGYYQQNFEGTTFPPNGWRVENVAGPTYTWVRSTAQAHASTASAFIRYDAATGGGQDWLIAPRYLVTATTDSITFWMRLAYQSYAPDSLSIKISTTDSLSSSFTTTLLKLQEGVNYPPNSTTWYRYAISLQNYIGQQIYLGFKHYDNNGDGLYVDDVALGTVPPAEVSSTAITSPVSSGVGTFTPQATFMNNGSVAQTFNVTMEINPGGYTSTSTITALAPNASDFASFATWTPTPGTYTAKVYTQLPGDANHLNDTLYKTVVIYPEFQNYGWSTQPALPAGRWATGPVFSKLCLSSTDTGYIYLISGGDASFANTALNTRYNIATGTYMNMAPIPTSRTQIAPIRVGGKIYVIGGYGGSFSPVTNNDIYNITTNTWTSGAPIPSAVGDYAIGSYGDSLIYVISGYTGSADVNLVQIYNVNTNTWMTGTPKSGTAVAGARMGISGNKIVFMGGYSQTLAATQSDALLGVINTSNPALITWSTLPAFPGGTTGRHGGGTALENNGLVYFASGDPNGQGTQTINAVFAYNTVLNQWEHGPNIPAGVSNISSLAGVVNNDSLYLVAMGGYNGTAVVTNQVWLNVGPENPLPYAQNDTAVCAGSSITLNAYNSVNTYTWTPAASLSNPNISNPVATPSGTTTYTVTMNKAYGCPVSDMVTLTVNPLPTVVANTSASAVCDGSPVTLSGSGAVSYTWTGSVTDNVAFTPVATDTYTVTGTDANGCTNTDMTTVTVNPLPNVTASTSAAAVCDGDSVILNGNGAVSYTWTNSVMDNMAFAPAATATYTVTGTDANGCMNMDSIMVTVNPLPTVVANTSAATVCFGTNVTLSGSGATSYTWTGSVTDNVAFTPNATDTYTVSGTDANGCMNMDSVMVTVNMLPEVTASAAPATSVCSGSSVTLSGSGASTYTWTGNVTDNVAFTPASTNTYTVTGTDANGCSASDVITVTVNPLPNVTVSLSQNTMCVDDANLVLSGGSPVSGTWSGTGVSGGSFDPSVTGAGTQTVSYSYTDANGCSASANASITVNVCAGVAEIAAQNGIAIYPNPNNGAFTIQLAVTPASPVQVEISNGLGQIVNAFTMTDNSKQVDITLLDNGVYFVRVINGSNVSVQRMIKQ